MKKSIYNTYLHPTENSTIIYNALTDTTVVIPDKIICDTNILDLNESLLSKLVTEGFIIDDIVDERDEFIKSALAIEKNDTSFHLIINPTINCNFHCWYCYESHIASKMGPEMVERVKLLIDKIINEGKNLTISFFGGEPMLYYNEVMVPILKHAYDKSSEAQIPFSANMTSNGFLLSEKRIKAMKMLNFTGAQITLDGDKDIHNSIRFRHKGDDTFTHIVNNIKLMVKNGMSVTLRVNCSKDNMASIGQIPAYFNDLTCDEKKLIRVNLQIVWQDNNRKEIYAYMDNMITAFSNEGIPSAKMDFRSFCYGDIRNSCMINYNGDIYKCTAVDFAKTPRDGYLSPEGEIIWENDSLEKRMASKFKNPNCRHCRIFPLCHGGCTKQSMGSTDYCMHNFDDDEKDSIVTNRILLNVTSC